MNRAVLGLEQAELSLLVLNSLEERAIVTGINLKNGRVTLPFILNLRGRSRLHSRLSETTLKWRIRQIFPGEIA